jgi:hypothetical protein
VSKPSKEQRKLVNARWQSNNREKVRASYLKTYYKLTWEDYLNLYEKQHGQCAICLTPIAALYQEGVNSKKDVAHVDHCHETGRVRGLLCRYCNVGIGHLKDSALLCKLASKYLEKESD